MGFTRADLKDLDKVWEEAKGQSSADVGEVPEGKYQMKIMKMSLEKSSGGRPQCICVYKVVGGVDSLIGKEITIYEGLETVQNMGFFAKKLRRLKLSMPDSFEDMPETLGKAIGAVIEGQVKYKDDFVNVYVNKLVSSGTEEEKAEEEKPVAKPAVKPGSKAAAKAEPVEDEDPEDPDEDGVKDPEDPEEESGEAEGTEAATRNFPKQEEIDAMKTKGLVKLLAELGVKGKDDRGDKKLRGACKALVGVMEDDAYEAPEYDLKLAATWLGLKPKEGRKELLRQIIAKLSE